MGWDFGPRNGKTPVEEVVELFSKSSILAAEYVGGAVRGTVYAAYKLNDEIVALVVSVEMNDREIGTKVMDERMLPFYYSCPERIFNMLTPTTHHYASEWRRRVLAWRQKGPHVDLGFPCCHD